MKITGPGSIRPVAPRSGSAQRTRAAARFSPASGEEATAARPGGAAPVGPIAAILALQEVPDALDGRSRGLRRGRALLDHLEGIRDALLAGRLPPARLEALRKALAQERASVDDPRLAAILDEIELRAAVELAKLGMAP